MSNLIWTYEALQEEALKYTRRVDFSKGSPSAYTIAARKNLLSNICSHMALPPIKWTMDSISAEALKFNTRLDFQANSTAYQAAARRGILDIVCAHMQSSKTGLKSQQEFMSEIESIGCKDYEVLSDYTGRHSKVQMQHIKCNTTWEVTPANFINKHSRCPNCMKGSDGDLLYLWNLEGTDIYKIGTSSARLGIKRIKEVSRELKVNYIIKMLVTTANAVEIERRVLSEFTVCPITIPKLKTGGISEFRILSANDVKNLLNLVHKELK